LIIFPIRKQAPPRIFAGAIVGLIFLAILSGCSRFQHLRHEYVYVAARQVFLHDRVAAVSNRVGQVTNGEELELLERGHRFVKVRTPKGEVGWLEEHAVIDDKLYQQFADLSKKHAEDPVVANAQLRDDLYMHVLPGRDTDHFLLIPGNSKVQLLARGTVEKRAPGSRPAKPKTPATAALKPAESSANKPVSSPALTGAKAATPAAKTLTPAAQPSMAPEPPPM